MTAQMIKAGTTSDFQLETQELALPAKLDQVQLKKSTLKRVMIWSKDDEGRLVAQWVAD